MTNIRVIAPDHHWFKKMACRLWGIKPLQTYLNQCWFVPNNTFHFHRSLNQNSTISFKKMNVKMSSPEWWPFWLGHNVISRVVGPFLIVPLIATVQSYCCWHQSPLTTGFTIGRQRNYAAVTPSVVDRKSALKYTIYHQTADDSPSVMMYSSASDMADEIGKLVSVNEIWNMRRRMEFLAWNLKAPSPDRLL